MLHTSLTTRIKITNTKSFYEHQPHNCIRCNRKVQLHSKSRVLKRQIAKIHHCSDRSCQVPYDCFDVGSNCALSVKTECSTSPNVIINVNAAPTALPTRGICALLPAVPCQPVQRLNLPNVIVNNLNKCRINDAVACVPTILQQLAQRNSQRMDT